MQTIPRVRRLAPPLAALTLALLGSIGSSAAASQSPYRVNEAIEIPVTLGLTISALLVPRLLFADPHDAPPCGRCDPSSITLPPDRATALRWSPTAAWISDGLLGALLGAAALIPAIDAAGDDGDGLEGWGRDTLVATEALAINWTLMQLVKYSVRRPRPLSYNPEVPRATRTSPDASLSFFSGHASTAFTAAAATSYSYWSRHPDATLGRALVLGSTLATATLVATLRVAAGKHFFSDVLVGAIIGGAVGLLVPHLHRRDKPAEAAASQPLRLPVGFAGAF